MSFFKKVGSGVKDATQSAALEAEYVKGKKSGYPHPPEVEEHIEIMRGMRDELKKLRDRLGDLDSNNKALAEAEAKTAEHIMNFTDIPMQNPDIASVYRVYSEGKNLTSTKRNVLHTLIGDLKEDMKPLVSDGLGDIKTKQDKANRAASDLHYYQKNNKTALAQETQQKYDLLSVELIDLIHILRVKKEEQIPNMLMRLALAEAEFHRQAADYAESVAEQIRQIGRVEPQPNVYGTMARGNTETNTQPTSQAPPPVVRPTPSGPRAQGLYQFNAESPQELSFMPGDVLTILNQKGDWWTAELNGRSGLIPANYVQLI
eukprot:TRINITY_DN8455_c0_g1_i1.p1 TRINITY_DN8455_c0_g1~~TRINITY_DN8455_c0_g1_i1.p1  ORF type:complete len:317 (+),score=84.30 TRINITY_DN8455_c0_g1_i1:131-1081(+)